jgi:hypothetical protein
MQPGIQQSVYGPTWASYEAYDYSDPMNQTQEIPMSMNPAAILARSSSGGSGNMMRVSAGEPPATIEWVFFVKNRLHKVTC